MTNTVHLFSLAAESFQIRLLLNHLAEILTIGAVLAAVRVFIEEAGCFMRLKKISRGQKADFSLLTSASDWVPRPRQLRQAFIRNVKS